MRLAVPERVVNFDGAPKQCQHRSAAGASNCPAVLDERGHHARTCKVGGFAVTLHNAVRDCCARRWPADTGAYVVKEQRVPQYDYADKGRADCGGTD